MSCKGGRCGAALVPGSAYGQVVVVAPVNGQMLNHHYPGIEAGAIKGKGKVTNGDVKQLEHDMQSCTSR